MTPFGTLLRQYRLSTGLSQNECAHRSDLDPAMVNRLEAGTRMPSPDVVLRLARTLALGRGSTDRLLIAAGHCPPILRQMTERQLEALYALAGLAVIEPARLRVLQ
jgi:transcriptional regulator with XRE-family HTH domain